jgi:hypothetical protein
LAVASAIGGSGTLQQGSGTLNLNGAVTGQALLVSGGQVKLGLGDATATSPNHALTAVSIESGASVQLTLDTLKLVQATSLTITGTGRLDLTNNAFVLDYAGSVPDPAKLGALASLLATGFDGGLWDGAGGITTSIVAAEFAANPAGYQYLTGIGYMPGALTGGSFLGRAVDAGSVVARYTYYGDANLDGIVNGLDYSIIDSGFAAQHNPGFVYSWSNGDFNYDGQIDGSDYALIDTAYAFSQGKPLELPSASTAAFSAAPEEPDRLASTTLTNSEPAAVPEPGSCALLAAGGLLVGLGRRSRRPANAR